jgi:hypothetical protein
MDYNFRIGSTIPSLIIGSSPYGGRWQAFNYSQGLQTGDNTMLRVGREVEDYISRAAIAAIDTEWLIELGLPPEAAETFKIKPTPSVHWESNGVPYRDTPDGKIVRSSRHHKPVFLLEAKRCQYSDRAEWANPIPIKESPDGEIRDLEGMVPQYYYDQCQHHMTAHPGVSAVLMPVIFNWTDIPRIYVVSRNEERAKELKEANEAFWFDHILPEIPPETDSSDAMKDYLKRQEATKELYPNAKDDDYLHMFNLMEAKEHLKKVEAIIQERENVLKESIGENYGLTFIDNGRITFKPNKHGTRTLSFRGVKKDLLYAHGGEITE